MDNLKGDRDSNAQNGHITVDEADPEHPIIRFDGNGVSGTYSVVTKVVWDEEDYKIVAKGLELKFEKGVLVSATGDDSEEDKLKKISEIETTPWTGE